MENSFFVYAEYCPGTPWMEFRILKMDTHDVVVWKAFILPNASADIGIFLGLAKAQQYIKENYSFTNEITIYCNEPVPVKWFDLAKCEHGIEDSQENELLLEMITSAEQYIKLSDCISVEAWTFRKEKTPAPPQK